MKDIYSTYKHSFKYFRIIGKFISLMVYTRFSRWRYTKEQIYLTINSLFDHLS